MNEKTSHNGSLDHSASDELLARVAATDPAAGFDASTLSATLVDDIVARAASAPAQGWLVRQVSNLRFKAAETYSRRPRFVLGSGLGAAASIAAIAVIGSIAIGSNGGGQRTLFTIAQTQAGAPALSDSKVSSNTNQVGGEMGAMIPAFFNHYSAAADLSNNGGSEHIYSMVPQADPSSFLQKLATHFGITSKVHKGTYSDFTTNPDETAPYDPQSTRADLSLSVAGPANWWLNVNQATPMTCAVDAASTDPKSCAPTTLTSPATAPSDADAKSEFIAAMQVAGYDFARQDITLQRDQFSTFATAQIELQLSGKNVSTSLMFSMSWNEKGVMTGASGVASQLVDQGSFEIISPAAAVQRANDSKWSSYLGFGGGVIAYDMVNPEGQVMRYGSLAGDTAPPVDNSSSAGSNAVNVSTPAASDAPEAVEPNAIVGDGGVAPTPIAVDDGVPQRQEVIVDRVELTWMQINDASGRTWLVPAYLLFSAEVSYQVVPAIADGIIGF